MTTSPESFVQGYVTALAAMLTRELITEGDALAELQRYSLNADTVLLHDAVALMHRAQGVRAMRLYPTQDSDLDGLGHMVLQDVIDLARSTERISPAGIAEAMLAPGD